jgi:oligosaccharide repeat unit polymerase
MKIDISKPNRILFLVWSFSLMLHQMALTTNIVDANKESMFLLIGCLASSIVISALIPTRTKRNYIFILQNGFGHKSRKFINWLLIFWISGSLIDITYSGGLPIIWSLTGSSKDYTEFGVPSFHGIVNAAYLFLVTAFFLDHLLTKNSRSKKIFIALLFWPILMLGRGILLGAMVQCLGAYLVLRKVSLETLFKILLFALTFTLLFGFIGNIRSGGNVLAYLIPPNGVLDFLPEGFLWVYIYITTGLNNIFFSYPTIEPTGIPFYSILNLVPSAVKKALGNFELNESLIQLVDTNLNTSTFLAGYVSDFGFLGGIIATTVLIASALLLYNSARKGKTGSLIGYSVIFQCLIFSPFYDMLLLLPTIFQMVITLIFNTYTRTDYNQAMARVLSINNYKNPQL